MLGKLVDKLYTKRKHDPVRREFLKKCLLYSGSLTLPLLFPLDSKAGKVYKWKDKNGAWHFSDRYPTKPTENVQTLNIYLPQDNNQNILHPEQKKTSNLGKISRKYNTTIHKGLDMESEVHDIRSDYKTIDNIINEVREEIKIKDSFDKKEAVKILKIISRTITKRHNFSSYTLYEPNCTKAHLYYAIGEALNLPIDVLRAPHHTFIRFNLNNGDYINWESHNNGEIIPNFHYIKGFNIAQTSINNCVYLIPISKNQILAHFYNKTGLNLIRSKKIKRGIEYYKRGLRLDSKLPMLLNNMGSALLRLRKADKAIPYFNESIRLNPNYEKPYYNRSIAWKLKGNLNKAEEDNRESERLKKESARSLRRYQ